MTKKIIKTKKNTVDAKKKTVKAKKKAQKQTTKKTKKSGEITTERERRKAEDMINNEILRLNNGKAFKWGMGMETVTMETRYGPISVLPPKTSQIINLCARLEIIEGHPVRFKDLQDRLKKKKDTNLSAKDFETLRLALTLAGKYQEVKKGRAVLSMMISKAILAYKKATKPGGKGHEQGHRDMGHVLGVSKKA